MNNKKITLDRIDITAPGIYIVKDAWVEVRKKLEEEGIIIDNEK